MSREESDRSEPPDAPAIAEALLRGGSVAGQSPEPGAVGGRPAVGTPEDLEHVGPATATVIESAPFDAAAVAAKSVSYRELLEAGIDPAVADRLRRTYSLVWCLEWRVGDGDLRERADRVRGLGAPERRWIAESADGASDRGEPAASDGGRAEASRPRESRSRGDEGASRESEDDPGEADGGERCERCGGELSTYALGGKQTVRCEECGYVGVSRGDTG